MISRTNLCPLCGGTGRILNDAFIGKEMRQLRQSKNITGRELARRLKLSAAYISDLEKGRRKWRAELQEKFKQALGVNSLNSPIRTQTVPTESERQG